jgi:hypothetical protein
MMATIASSSSVALSSACSLSTINDIAAELITSNSSAAINSISVTNNMVTNNGVSNIHNSNSNGNSTASAMTGIAGEGHHSSSHRQSLTSQSPPIIAPSLSKCPLCSESYVQPKVMSCCFATFCQSCLDKQLETPDRIKCPGCGHESLLPSNGAAGLLSDYATVNMLEQIASLDASMSSTATVSCTGCKSKELPAVARCFDCANFLCPNCVMAHQFMHCFEGHRVITLGEPNRCRVKV